MREDSRFRQLQQAIDAQDIDALMLRLPENVLLATRYWVQLGGLGLVLIPRKGEGALLVPDYEEPEASERWDGPIRTFSLTLSGPPPSVAIESSLRQLAGQYGPLRKVGFEGGFESVAPPCHAAEPNAISASSQQLFRAALGTDHLVDCTEILEALRAKKTPDETEQLRVTNEIAMFGLEAFKELAEAGRTEAEIAALVEAAIQTKGHGYRGARTVRAYAQVWSGPDTSVGWWAFRSRARTVEQNDLVMIELATVADGYWSDHTRTVVAGRPTDRQRQAFAATKTAQDAAIRNCTAGATGGEVDAAARAAFSAAGFQQFPHHTGHGVGFRYHETRPMLVPDGKHRLVNGMILAVEPGLYEADFGGFRWEDDVLVTDSGGVRLADTKYGLD
jgi:Xaa-Pro aminopeptidase